MGLVSMAGKELLRIQTMLLLFHNNPLDQLVESSKGIVPRPLIFFIRVHQV